MKLKPLLARLLMLVTPIAGVSFAATPSQAASLAYSGSEFDFYNFSQNPDTISTLANTNTDVFSNGGVVDALALAKANFTVDPAVAFNSSVAQAFGEDSGYLGLAQSQAQVLGNFIVEAGNAFYFDFTGLLEMGTEIDDPEIESASALGNTYFVLLDSTDSANSIVLDYFGIAGNLTTPNNNDFLEFDNSEYVTLTNQSIETDFGSNQEYGLAYFTGTYYRDFSSTINLTLVEVKQNEAKVKVPESSNTLALLLFSTIGVGYGMKKATMKKEKVRRESCG